MRLEVTTRRLRGHLVVAVSGDIDLATSPAFSEHLRDAQAEHSRIVVDMAEVGFMDATGIRALCDGHEHAARLGGSLGVVAPQPIVRRVLAITHVDERVHIYPSLVAAISHAAGAKSTRPLVGAA